MGKPPMCVFLSGTLIKDEIAQAAHLGEMALGDGSPWPQDAATLITWGEALDPGAWLAECSDLDRLAKPGESYRAAFARRVLETQGVVVTHDKGQISARLTMHEWPVAVPEEVASAYRRLEAEWVRPDGEELVEALEKEVTARQLSAGFHYYRTWPNGEPEELREEWLEAGKQWRREVRRYLLDHARPHLDSPGLLERAAEREASFRARLSLRYGHMASMGRRDQRARMARAGRLAEHLGWPFWAADAYPRWRAVRDAASPGTATRWLSPFLADAAKEWVARVGPGIIWVEHLALGARISQTLGCPFYGEGEEAAAAIVDEKGDRAIVASVDSHHYGKNLQAFRRCLVTTPGANAVVWEQLIGREHREGQKADEVDVYLCLHTPALREAFRKALEHARFLEEIWGHAPQKLRYANYAFEP